MKRTIRHLQQARERIDRLVQEAGEAIQNRDTLLRELHEYGHSQASLAREAGLTPGRVSQILKGDDDEQG